MGRRFTNQSQFIDFHHSPDLWIPIITMAQMAHFSFPYYYTIPKFALRISEFGIVKYMLYGQVVTANLL